ncbi:MAG: hypothetical protein P8170_08115 [Gemmatimonadota bacterium]|jgi:hypothetical protein
MSRAALALLLLGCTASLLEGQETHRVTVQVRQVAGSNLYVDLGTRHGLASGDTLLAARDTLGSPEGRLVVVAATEDRSVMAFASDPFPVTRGASLVLYLLRAAEEVPPTPAGTPTGAERAVPVAPEPSAPAPYGRIGLEMSASRSRTFVGETDPESVERTFATPVLRIDATVPRAVGGFTLKTSLRAAHRHASGTVIAPSTSVRVYAAQLERDFESVPLRVAFGRFSNPVESYSGYWDGLLVRVGRRGFGVGAIVGFEPERWNERPSTERPKATAFMDVDRRGRSWRWRGSVSAHTLRPSNGLAAHTFLGAGQRLSLRRLTLSQDLQMDRDPSDGAWRLSRMLVRGSLRVGGPFAVRAGFSRRESYVFGSLQPFAPRSDRLDAGFSVRGQTGFLSADVGVNEDVQGSRTWGTAGTFVLYRIAGLGSTGASGSVTRWTGPNGDVVAGSPSLTRDLGSTRVRLGYQFSHADYLGRVTTTHGTVASADARLGEGVRVVARVRVQWMGALRSEGVDLRLYRIF